VKKTKHKINMLELGAVSAASGFFHTLEEVVKMYEGRRVQSPFDDSAANRLQRMGLADEKGTPTGMPFSSAAVFFRVSFSTISATILRAMRMFGN